jgi:outer membrane protein assembly factor BamB
MFVKPIFVFLLCLVFVSCAHKPETKSSREFHFTKSWARHTIEREYMSYRLNHIMQPVLYGDLVVQGNEVDGLSAYNIKYGYKKWHIKIQGGVTSSARLSGDTLYFGAGDGFFYAVDLKTGTTQWTFPIRSEGIGAPLISEGVVYFLSGNNVAYAVKAKSGEQIWLYNRTETSSFTIRGASEPTLVGSNVIFGFSDGNIAALDKNSGQVKWERLLGESIRFKDVDSKAVLDENSLYVSSYDGKLYSLNANSGQINWTHDEGGFLPVYINEDRVFLSTSNRKLVCLDKKSGKVLWENKLMNTVASTPVAFKGILFFNEWAGSVRAVDLTTGEKMASFNTGRGVTSAPTIDTKNNKIFVMSADANLFALNLNWLKTSAIWPWESSYE